MILAPRYDGTAILSIEGPPSEQRDPFIRQRMRMQDMLGSLTEGQWATASRCAEWTVRDVIAHLVTVNAFWRGSIVAGLADAPTRMLVGFDPAATPPLLVDSMSSLSTEDVLDQFSATTEALIDVVSGLTDTQWMAAAESPAGIVPVSLLVQHALWDSWVHERDVAIPLGIAPTNEPDELRTCLRFAAAISPALGIGLQRERRGTFAVDASEPTIRFVLDVGDSVAVRNGAPEPGVPCLHGDADALIEALSLRAPMPESTPAEWTALLDGLESAFDAV